jgi:hypothetical protein
MFDISLYFKSNDKERYAFLASDACEKGLAFIIETKRKKIAFNPLTFQSIHSSGASFFFNSLNDMMIEVSGLLMIAKGIYIQKNKLNAPNHRILLHD